MKEDLKSIVDELSTISPDSVENWNMNFVHDKNIDLYGGWPTSKPTGTMTLTITYRK